MGSCLRRDTGKKLHASAGFASGKGTVWYTHLIGDASHGFIWDEPFGPPRAWSGNRHREINLLLASPINARWGETHVIELTRLNGSRLGLNSDLIQYMEASPDTTLTLINGEKLVVRESADQVIELTLAYRARLIAGAARECPGGLMIASSSLWQANAALTTGPEDEADAHPGAVLHCAGR
jgi:flagellar protein FlbD